MAKRKKHKQSSKCPEPLNTMIDLAGGITMGLIAGHMEKKHRYKARGKINPYEVSAFGLASGRMKSTEDILRTGAVLGALGSFDDDLPRSYVPDDPIFSDLEESKVKDNRYAWRLNCEDGSAYGIDPEDYETRDEYNEALAQEKYAWRDWCEDGFEYGLDPEDFETEEEYNDALEEAKNEDGSGGLHIHITIERTPEPSEVMTETPAEPDDDAPADPPEPPDSKQRPVKQTTEYDDLTVFIYCKVELPDKQFRYYRTQDKTIKKGDRVSVPLPDGTIAEGTVLSVEHPMSFSAPTPVDETPEILRRKQ